MNGLSCFALILDTFSISIWVEKLSDSISKVDHLVVYATTLKRLHKVADKSEWIKTIERTKSFLLYQNFLHFNLNFISTSFLSSPSRREWRQKVFCEHLKLDSLCLLHTMGILAWLSFLSFYSRLLLSGANISSFAKDFSSRIKHSSIRFLIGCSRGIIYHFAGLSYCFTVELMKKKKGRRWFHRVE